MVDPKLGGLLREVKVGDRRVFVLTAKGLEALGYPELARQQREAAKANLERMRIEPTTADATAGMRRGVR